jgi:hypothetical protein
MLDSHQYTFLLEYVWEKAIRAERRFFFEKMTDEIASWVLALATVVLALATMVLAYFTRRLGGFALELNRIEKRRDDEARTEMRRVGLGKAIELGRSIEGIQNSVYADKVLAGGKANPVAMCRPIEEMLKYTDLFSAANKQLLSRLIREILGHAESGRQGTMVVSNREALEKEMQQFKDKIGAEIVLWREELVKLSP